jgi:hypothetical protein
MANIGNTNNRLEKAVIYFLGWKYEKQEYLRLTEK